MRRVLGATLLTALSSCTLLSGVGDLSVGEAPATHGDSGAIIPPDSGSLPPTDGNATIPADGGKDVTTPPTPNPIAFVHASTMARETAAKHGITIPATTAGNLLVIVFAQESDTAISISAVTDNVGSVYASAKARSADPGCNDDLEVWYAVAKAGATQVVLDMSGSGAGEAWAVEFSGVSTLDATDVSNSNPASTTIIAPPVTPTVSRALVLSATQSCGDAKTLLTTSFTALQMLSGETLSFFIANASGSYGASWTSSADTWNASTVAFR